MPLDDYSFTYALSKSLFCALVSGFTGMSAGTLVALLYPGHALANAAEPNPLVVDIKSALYISVSSMLGLLSAFASLLGSGDQILNPRIVAAYLLAGALVSAGLTFLLAAQYGFSYFLLGISIFAGYKAFDMLAMIGIAVSSLVKRILGKR